MIKTFKSMVNTFMLLSAIIVILGIVMVAMPESSILAFGICMGIYLIFHGIMLIVVEIKAKKYYLPVEGLILEGILAIVLGVLFLMDPGNNMQFLLAFGVGVWIISAGIRGIQAAIALKSTGIPWVLIIILNLIDIAAGVFVLFSPAISSVSIVICVGVVMIIHGIVNLADAFALKKNVKDLKKYVKGRYDELSSYLDSVDADYTAEEEN